MHAFWEELVRATSDWLLDKEDTFNKKIKSLNRCKNCWNKENCSGGSFAVLPLIVDLAVIKVRPKCKNKNSPEH